MNLTRASELVETAADSADAANVPVAVRARLALARRNLRENRHADARDHLRVVMDRASLDAVSTPVGNALQLVETVENGGETV